jgi:hypothetical protein
MSPAGTALVVIAGRDRLSFTASPRRSDLGQSINLAGELFTFIYITVATVTIDFT